jgi:hypothetical protein
MRKYLLMFFFCFSMAGLNSCATSKKSSTHMTAEEKKKEKEAKKAKEAELQKRGPVQEANPKPAEQDNRTKTIPIPLENK